jgi:predicted enzyme related to lactoylglutathione lyase
VPRVVSGFVARGAAPLGPTRTWDDGTMTAVLSDPGGAVLGVSTSVGPPKAGVVWHVLSSGDVARASAAYCEVLGWQLGRRVDLGDHGVFVEICEVAGASSFGSMVDIRGRAGRHPHWLFHFRIADLDAAVARTRAAGGLVLEPMTLPGGDRIAVCNDPQGAAFCLHQPAGQR